MTISTVRRGNAKSASNPKGFVHGGHVVAVINGYVIRFFIGLRWPTEAVRIVATT